MNKRTDREMLLMEIDIYMLTPENVILTGSGPMMGVAKRVGHEVNEHVERQVVIAATDLMKVFPDLRIGVSITNRVVTVGPSSTMLESLIEQAKRNEWFHSSQDKP